VSDAPRLLEVAPPDAGRRLDVFLAERLGLSRAQTRRLLARGVVRLDGRELSERAKGLAVHPGEVVAVEPFTPPAVQRARAEPDRPLRELASGPGWIALDKPAGVAVHPLEPDEGGTLLGALLARHPEVHGVGEGALRSGVVHRLDVDTSGAVLFALEQTRWQRLRAAFAGHRVDKRYRALVCGRLSGSGDVELPLLMARHRPARVRVASESEAAAARGVWRTALRWRALEVFDDATLLEVRPLTGFLHQIRATLAYLGHPLLGDRSYGAPATAGVRRHLLHAASVAWEDVRAAAPDAPDFAARLAQLREGR
jgi:23S rRNA pseudouridine1911/1915/1917 synthase